MRVRNLALYLVAFTAIVLLNSCVTPGGGRATHDAGDGGRSFDSLHVTVPRLIDMRIYGEGDPTSQPFLQVATPGKGVQGIGAKALTLVFDMQSDEYPNVTLNLVHCDRNWKPTENIFVQDPVRLRSNDFEVVRAPVGVRHFDYTLKTTFPKRGGRISVDHSGNYLAQIVDYYHTDRVLGEARFFAVEGSAAVRLDIYSDFYQPEQTSVLGHGLKIRAEAEPGLDIFGGQIFSIELFQNGAWYTPIIAGGDSLVPSFLPGNPWVRWYPSFAGKVFAEFSNLPAGNEHRLLDLTDLLMYPSTGVLVTTPLSDQPRRSFAEYDNNGVAVDRLVPYTDADYVMFEFRLDLKGSEVREDIVVLGSFNNWLPSAEWVMKFDSLTGFYTARGWLRRAVHEYEYRAGTWDRETGTFRGGDATLIEGNDRTATQLFFAPVYYRETASGGYDRIVGVGANVSGRY